MNKNVIITISRQYGSGGKLIGERLARSLGIPCYDKVFWRTSQSWGFRRLFRDEKVVKTVCMRSARILCSPRSPR
ncbi:MAG: cytidylate kinase family protein [Merdibacter sp.]